MSIIIKNNTQEKGEIRMDKEYLKKQYHLALLESKTAHNEDEQWKARKTMARLERTALELFGDRFLEELRKENGLEIY